MLNTMLLSFSLKNTYRVNAILHSLKQIPLLKRLLPDTLYRVRGLKIFANVLAALYELLHIRWPVGALLLVQNVERDVAARDDDGD